GAGGPRRSRPARAWPGRAGRTGGGGPWRRPRLRGHRPPRRRCSRAVPGKHARWRAAGDHRRRSGRRGGRRVRGDAWRSLGGREASGEERSTARGGGDPPYTFGDDPEQVGEPVTQDAAAPELVPAAGGPQTIDGGNRQGREGDKQRLHGI